MPLQKYQCQYCEKIFYKPDWRHSKYCNRKCFNLNLIGKLLSEERRKNISKGKKGIKFSDKHLKNLSLAHKGYKAPISQRKKISEGLKRAWIQGKFEHLKGKESSMKGKEFPQIAGKNHWNWKGGISPRDMSSARYKNWRKAIFTRDNYTCWVCENNKSGEFIAHHLKQWSLYPKLRYKVSNGLMLCIFCHKIYGNHTSSLDKLLRNLRESK